MEVEQRARHRNDAINVGRVRKTQMNLFLQTGLMLCLTGPGPPATPTLTSAPLIANIFNNLSFMYHHFYCIQVGMREAAQVHRAQFCKSHFTHL